MGDDIRDTFKRSLNRLIEKTSVSQADLARILDVSPTTVNNWVKGYNVPRMDKIDMLCKYFDVSRDYFIGSPDESRFYYLDEATRVAPLTGERGLKFDIVSIITVSFVNSL